MRVRTCCPVVELRQYTLVPGARETLIELFEREFIETQEAAGMTVIGQFRDLNNPDRFVWLRGFSDMDARATQLQAFYSGPVWKAHRDAANATMIDSRQCSPIASGVADFRISTGACQPCIGWIDSETRSFGRNDLPPRQSEGS